MRQLNSNYQTGFDKQILKFAYFVMGLIGTVLFFTLSICSLVSSQYMLPGREEIPIMIYGKIPRNLLFLLLFIGSILFFRYVEKNSKEKTQVFLSRTILVMSMLWILTLCFWWIFSLDRVPQGDQAYIYGGASYFIEGDFSLLQKGGYCNFYPQQLGQIFIIEILFRIVGVYQYRIIQVICACFAVAIDWLGYRILKSMEQGFTVRAVYCILMMGCMPLVGYTSWVYGDVPSIFFILLVTLLVLKLHKKNQWYYYVGICLFCVLAALVRMNSTIFLIAFMILAILHAIAMKKSRMLLAAALAILCVVFCYKGVYWSYEMRSGIKLDGGLPANSWIAMGMQESFGRCGWHNNYPKEVGQELDWDYSAVSDVMNQYIKERCREFVRQPKEAVVFYIKKIVSQWNEPLYQSIYFSTNYKDAPAQNSFLHYLYDTDSGYFKVFSIADAWQFVIYFGIFLYFLKGISTSEPPIYYLLGVTILGGFFFSILWEAKARYTFPYYVMMYPLAVKGYVTALEKVEPLVSKRLKRGISR